VSSGAAEGQRGELIRAGGAAEAEVDTAGEERLERPELLRDQEGRVVRQHDAAGADPDGPGPGGNMADHDRRRRARHRRHVVVLGEPIALVAEPLGVPGQVQRIPQRLAGAAALDDGREVEH
jgi:hypothetical protein